jgi:hypothetical protein
VSFLIRKSSDLWLCAPTRSLSQLITSFIGSWCQGIHHAPFVAWPIFASLFLQIAASPACYMYSRTEVRSVHSAFGSLHSSDLTPLSFNHWCVRLYMNKLYEYNYKYTYKTLLGKTSLLIKYTKNISWLVVFIQTIYTMCNFQRTNWVTFMVSQNWTES